MIPLMVRVLLAIVIAVWAFAVPGLSRAQTLHVDSCASGPGDGSTENPYRRLTDAVDAAASRAAGGE